MATENGDVFSSKRYSKDTLLYIVQMCFRLFSLKDAENEEIRTIAEK